MSNTTKYSCATVRFGGATYVKVTDINSVFRNLNKVPRSDNSLGYNRALADVKQLLAQLLS
jgi:hypothetical protein